MRKKIVLGIVIVLLAGAGLYFALSGKTNGVQYKTVKVTTGNIQATVTATGTVNPVVTVNVGSQVSGSIKRIYADFNSVVKKGQVIAEIDPSTFQAQVNQARAAVLVARANVLKAKAMLLDSKRVRDRNQQLISKDLIARSDFDTADANWQSNEAQVKAAEAQVGQAQASLDLAETNLRFTRILSPVDGTVVSRNVDVGQTVAASFQTPTLFYIAQDLTRMQINTSVDEADIGKVKVGQNVDFYVDAYPDILFKGKVSQVRISPVTVQNVVTYDVVVQVDNRELKLRPGMTANVSIIADVREGVLRIPNAALRYKPQEKGAKNTAPVKGQAVWILEDGNPRRVTILVGISDGTFTEMKSGGVKEGQEVIIESLAKTKSNSPPSSLVPRVGR